MYNRKYGVATAAGTHIGIQLLKAGSNDYALAGDWTPAAGDVKISIDGGALANITTLPTFTNGWWIFQFTTGELTGKSIRVYIQDAATKAVQDDGFIIETFGNASAMYPDDVAAAAPTPPTNWSTLSIDGAGAVTATGVSTLQTTATAIKAKTDNLPADPADASDIATATAAISSAIAAVQAKTDNLPANPAAATDIPSAATIAAAVFSGGAIDGLTFVEWLRVVGALIAGSATGLKTASGAFVNMALGSKTRVTVALDPTTGARTMTIVDKT